MRKIIFFLLFSISLFGRENPFFPATPQEDTPNYTTNDVQKLQPFNGTSISLPDSARILEQITITYINLDGSQSKKTIHIHNSLDWHKPLYITQSPTPTTTTVEKTYKQQKKEKFKKVSSLEFITFFVAYEKIQLHTKDHLIRDFKIVNPDRIVLDFKHDLNFRSYTFHANNIFKKIRIGNHDGYYRVVLELDGKYTYKIKKTPYGYLLTLE